MATTISVKTQFDSKATVGTTATAVANIYTIPLPSSVRNVFSNSQDIAGLGTITFGAGTISTATLTLSQLAGNPLFTIDKTGGLTGGANLVLPAPSTCPGVSFQIIQKSAAAATSAVAITTLPNSGSAAVNLFIGYANNVNTSLVGGVATTVTMTTVTTFGDYLAFFSDGTNWFFRGNSTIAAGIAIA